MRTRHELNRITVDKSNTTLKSELIEKGYNVLRKSKSTVIMVLWGEDKSEEELQNEIDAANERAARDAASRAQEIANALQAVKEAKAASQKEATIANLWRNFNRRPQAQINIKRNSFYFNTESGAKVRVSDHECFHFQNDSEKALFSRAAGFEAPDFDFVISDFTGKTRTEVVEIIKNTIK